MEIESMKRDGNEETELVQLPNELLMNIFAYVPNRWNLSFVCERFYKIVCKIERNLYSLSVKDEQSILDSSSYNSIINSERDINVIKLNITTRMSHNCWDRLEKIFAKFTAESLAIVSCDVRRESYEHLSATLMKLPVNILHDLSLVNISLENLQSFFHQQCLIENLSITGGVGASEAFNCLNLKCLKLIGPKSRNLPNIIAAQPNLTSLKLTIDEGSEYGNETFMKIADLSKLETLDIPLNNNISPEIISHLARLKHLQRMSVSCSQRSLQKLINTPIPSVRELDISFDFPCTSDSIEILAANIPNLTSLKLKGPLATIFLNDSVKLYPRLESLWFENKESYFVNILSLTPFGEAPIARLKHLFVINHDRKVTICASDLIRFIKKFPTLETLALEKFVDIQMNNFEAILRILPNLKEIIVESKSIDSTTKAMEIIRDHGRSLNFVALKNFKMQFDAETLKTFFEGRFSEIAKKDGHLVLRNAGRSYLEKNM